MRTFALRIGALIAHIFGMACAAIMIGCWAGDAAAYLPGAAVGTVVFVAGLWLASMNVLFVDWVCEWRDAKDTCATPEQPPQGSPR